MHYRNGLSPEVTDDIWVIKVIIGLIERDTEKRDHVMKRHKTACCSQPQAYFFATRFFFVKVTYPILDLPLHQYFLTLGVGITARKHIQGGSTISTDTTAGKY